MSRGRYVENYPGSLSVSNLISIVNIKNIKKDRLLLALYDATTPFEYSSIQKARSALEKNNNNIETFEKVAINVDLSGDSVDPTGYEATREKGKLAKVVKAIRSEMEGEPAKESHKEPVQQEKSAPALKRIRDKLFFK
jgi:hypothetical protein